MSWRNLTILFAASMVCLTILTAASMITTTLDEVCPEVEGGTEFLSANYS